MFHKQTLLICRNCLFQMVSLPLNLVKRILHFLHQFHQFDGVILKIFLILACSPAPGPDKDGKRREPGTWPVQLPRQQGLRGHEVLPTLRSSVCTGKHGVRSYQVLKMVSIWMYIYIWIQFRLMQLINAWACLEVDHDFFGVLFLRGLTLECLRFPPALQMMIFMWNWWVSHTFKFTGIIHTLCI